MAATPSLKGMWNDLGHFPVINSSCNMAQFLSVIIPHTQSAVLAEKFVDFKLGACKSIIRIWQAEARCSYRVTSWVSLHSASLQATYCHTAKLSVALAVQHDKSVVFPCSILSLNPRAWHRPRIAQSNRALTPSYLRSPIPPPCLHCLQ